MRFHIVHATRHIYANAVRDSFNEARLQPLSDARQTLESFDLQVSPRTSVRCQADLHGNSVHYFDIAQPHGELRVEAESVVRTLPETDRAESQPLVPMAELGHPRHRDICFDFLQSGDYVDISGDSRRMAEEAIGATVDVWQASIAIMRFLATHLTYTPNSTTVQTRMQEVLKQRRGVCQDFAHALIGLCRSVGIPARYVSGFLASEAANATHAWVEVFIPGVGWQGLDPTHDCIPGEHYVRLATGRDYGDVPPLRGRYRGTRERQLLVDVRIRVLDQSVVGGQVLNQPNEPNLR